MLESALQPCRTRDILTTPDGLLFFAVQVAAALADTSWASPTAVSPAGRLLRIGPDDARNDIAGFLDDHGVAGADVLPGDVVGVVQRGHRDRGAADEDRLEHGKRRHRSRASDIDRDLLEARRLLFGRKFERDGPARELAGGAELAPAFERVNLDDDAIGVEAEAAPLVCPLAAERDERVDAACSASSAARQGGPMFRRSSVSRMRCQAGLKNRLTSVVEAILPTRLTS